jgi:hypothetical protein
MSYRTTFAVLGVLETKSIFLAKLIAKTNSVLLFDQNQATLQAVYTEILAENPEANVEMMICPTNASWEADVIVLSDDAINNGTLIEKIKKVVTGKMVLILNDEMEPIQSISTFDKLRQLFPFSRVVQSIESSDDKDDYGVLKGIDKQALNAVLTLFTPIGLKTSIQLQKKINLNKRSNG